MSPKGSSQRSSCEPFTATQAQRAPTLFPPLGAEVGRGGGAGRGAALSYGRGSLSIRSFAARPHFFGKGGPPAGLPCGSQIPKFSTPSVLPPSARGGTSLRMCQPTARVQRARRGGLRRVSHPFGPVSVGGGWWQQKVCSPVCSSPTKNQPMACTLALWWLKFGPTEGGGGGCQKFVIRRLQAVGRHPIVATSPGRMVTQPMAEFQVGSSNPGRAIVVGAARAIFPRPGFGRPTQNSAFGCITVLPLLVLRMGFLPTARSRVCHRQKTQTVCICLSY